MNTARKPLVHRFNSKGYANDDELEINTQSSSHWDGLRHLSYQKARLFYNGVKQGEIVGGAEGEANLRIGIHNISRKPIAARGVLLDYRAWATPNSIAYSAFSTHRITLPNLLACTESQGTTFQPGDILLIRSGWMEDYLRLSAEQQDALGLRSQRDFVGVENTYSMAKWHWDMQFAAVAGDTNAYEAWPPTIRSSGVSAASDGNDHGNRGQGDGEDDGLGFALHEVFLAGWGMPIGEVWNLEKLARKCRERGRWSFFLTSQPLDVPGGVASPCNAMAVL